MMLVINIKPPYQSMNEKNKTKTKKTTTDLFFFTQTRKTPEEKKENEKKVKKKKKKKELGDWLVMRRRENQKYQCIENNRK